VRSIPSAAIELVKRFEGCKLQVNQDPLGIWQIGWSHAISVSKGSKLLQGEADRETAMNMYPVGITQIEADGLLISDLEIAAEDVQAQIHANLSDGEFAALVSLYYNLGGSQLRDSTLVKLLNLGNKRAAADQLIEWSRAGGATLMGLVRRRVAERDLYLGIA